MLRHLRWRLMLGSAAAILLAVGLTGVFVLALLNHHLEARVQSELQRDAERLVGQLARDPSGGLVLQESLADPRLGTPASGFYWQISDPAQVLGSRSLWDSSLPPAVDAPSDQWRLRRAAGPFDVTLLILERSITLDPNGPRVLVQMAEDASELQRARADFQAPLSAFLALLSALLIASSWLQIHLGLRPLGRIRADVARLSEGKAARLDRPRLEDVRPLVEAINRFADARDEDLARAQTRAADLAHGLKTPITALEAQIRALPVNIDDGARKAFARSVSSIRSAVEAELARTRVSTLPAEGTANAGKIVDELIGVIELAPFAQHAVLENAVGYDLLLPVSEEALREILGPVLENASRFARRRVVVESSLGDQGPVLAISDDGLGIDESRFQTIVSRGGRLDEADGGHGLGLAISTSMIERCGGSLKLAKSPLGGLMVSFQFNARAK